MSYPNFFLTPQQQDLLFAALNANRPSPPAAPLTLTPASLDASATPAPTSKPVDMADGGFKEDSLLDFDYSFDGADTSLDFSGMQHGDLSTLTDGPDGPGDMANDDSKTDSATSTNGNDSPDKRSHPDDDDDETVAAKRREGSDKAPKKPGRKPLTSEPTSKRKAQNRAAQRAFRERKEKHVKDLETKVEELEKASAAANSENGKLRAQVQKMHLELAEYKKRLSLANAPHPMYPMRNAQTYGSAMINHINDVNFQFEFPKFGQLPGPATTPTTSTSASANANTGVNTNTNSPAATVASTHRSPASDSLSPANHPSSSMTSPGDSTRAASAKAFPSKEDLSKLSNAFTPPVTSGTATHAIAPRSSIDSTTNSSPSTSPNTMPSSSCGTSPEPCNCNQPPTVSKPLELLTTIGEEQPVVASDAGIAMTNDLSMPSHLDGISSDDMSWLGAQSNFRFEPQLFGDYREPQDNILASGGFDEGMFPDSFDVDFVNSYMTASPAVAPKPDLISQIDAAKECEFSSSSLAGTDALSGAEVVKTPGEILRDAKIASGELLTCNGIWERLQSCPKVQTKEFDLDGLCSDLQKKAKCSGSGAVVNETDFKAVMSKYLGKDTDCADKFAHEVKKAEAASS